MPTPPPPPAPVDPAQSSLDWTRAMASPELQDLLLASEQQYRPQYTALNLQELNQYLFGAGGQPGALAMQDAAAMQSAQTAAGAQSVQRAADISDVEALGQRATAAFRAANPQLQQALSRAEGLLGGQQGGGYGEFEQGALAMQQRASGTPELGAVGSTLQGRAAELAASRGQLTPDELRSLQQATREAYAARGVEMGSGAISAEALARLSNERARMQEDLAMAAQLNQGGLQETAANRAFQQQALGNLGLLGQIRQQGLQADRGYALNLVGAQQAVASDPFQAILGRPSQALSAAQGQQQYAAGLSQSMQGPQLFDTNAGINLALQQQANLSNYQGNIYGAQAGLLGAQAGARGAMGAGIASGVGALAGGFLLGPLGAAIGGAAGGRCWVAREVYGARNPKWMQFREWLLNGAPKWFLSLYTRFGERFARFISNKPRLKNLIREWMDNRIESWHALDKA